MKYFYLFIAVTFLLNGSLIAQSDSAKQKINTIQPVIMVIPRVSQGEDIRTVLDNSFNKRLSVKKVNEAFDNRGFTTKSFEATLKNALLNKVFTSESQSDMKSTIIEMSGADIYVEVDIAPMTSGGGGNQVTLLLEASDCATGASYSNKTCVSGIFNVTDTSALISRAVDKCKEEFLNTLQAKFTDIVQNGRTVNVSFKPGENSSWTFDQELGDTPLSFIIEDWVAENSANNNYHDQGSGNLILLYEIRIPLKDDRGKNYTPKKFSQKIYTWLKSKGIQSGIETRGGTIYVTIK